MSRSIATAPVRCVAGAILLAGLAAAGSMASAQGLGLPGFSAGVPMTRPPQRPAPQAGVGGAPGQMNRSLAAPSSRPGQSIARPGQSVGSQANSINNIGKGAGSLGTINRADRQAATAKQVFRTSEQFKNINSGGNIVVRGYGPVKRKR